MVLAMIPHAYSVQVITSNNNKKWNNASPRSLSNLQMVEKSVSKEVRFRCGYIDTAAIAGLVSRERACESRPGHHLLILGLL